LPVVLDETDVVQPRVQADRRQRAEVEILQVVGVRLQDHLVLVIVLQPVGVLAVAPVRRPTRGLYIGGPPRLRPERAQHRRRVSGTGPLVVVELVTLALVPATSAELVVDEVVTPDDEEVVAVVSVLDEVVEVALGSLAVVDEVVELAGWARAAPAISRDAAPA